MVGGADRDSDLHFWRGPTRLRGLRSGEESLFSSNFTAADASLLAGEQGIRLRKFPASAKRVLNNRRSFD